MNKSIWAIALLAAGLGSAQAQDYAAEIGANYINYDTDISGADDSLAGVEFTYHLNGVSTKNGPLAEAAFNSRSNNLSVTYLATDESEVDAWVFGGEFYIQQFYLRAAYAQINNDMTSIDSDRQELRAGFMVVDGLRLSGGVNRTDSDAPGADAGTDTVLEFKYLTQLDAGTAVNAEGSLTFFDDQGSGLDTIGVSLSGDYYLSPRTSIGLSYDKVDSDAPNASSDDFGASVRHFFTPTFSGALGAGTAFDGDVDVIAVNLSLRF